MRKTINYIYNIIILVLLYCLTAQADNKNKLPLPRFASIKSDEVNVRVGPSLAAAVEWIFVKKHEPVEITAEYGQWRQIQDIKGEGGWVHASILSGKRFVIVKASEIINLMSAAKEDARIVAKIAPEVRCQLHKCIQDWCKIKCTKHEGWFKKQYLWGVDKT